MGKPSSIWNRVNSRFWVPPTFLTVGAVVLFAVAQYLDQVTPTSLSKLPIAFSGSASAARAVLAAIAGSLITVIATVFSITIVTLQLASSQYTPRLLRSFAADRGAQLVLGAYIATFVYSLLVLRIVRESESEAATFIPVISVTVAVVLALVCMALLIFFVYHVTNLIQPSTILARIQAETMEPIAKLDDLDGSRAPAKDLSGHPALEGLSAEVPSVVLARRSGYIQYMDVDAVVEAAAVGGETRVIEIPFCQGHFVASGLPLVRVWPARRLESASDSDDKALQGFIFGKERSFQQDFTFGLRQLTDIALKGLSPSVNDPTTAMQAMDQTEDILITLGTKALPPRIQEREIRGARVLVKIGYPGFDDVIEVAFDQVWRAAFATGQVIFLKRFLEIIERALLANASTERQQPLWERAFTVAYLAPQQIPSERDAVSLMQRTVEAGAPLLRTELSAAVGSDLEEIAGLSEGLRGGERVREAVDAAWEGP
jgi:uncharacterized membrane protein